MYVRTLEQGLHFFSLRGFKFDLCVQYAESILEMMCRGTVGHLLPRHDQLAKQEVLGGQMLMDPVGLVRIHVKYKPSEIISCTLCYYLHVPSLSPRIRTAKPTPLS